jgi:hypothetical protein
LVMAVVVVVIVVMVMVVVSRIWHVFNAFSTDEPSLKAQITPHPHTLEKHESTTLHCAPHHVGGSRSHLFELSLSPSFLINFQSPRLPLHFVAPAALPNGWSRCRGIWSNCKVPDPTSFALFAIPSLPSSPLPHQQQHRHCRRTSKPDRQ